MLVYLIVFATGNVQHDYYQVILVPIICVFLGSGAQMLIQGGAPVFNKWLSRIMLIISVVFVLMFGWYQARDLFNINHPEIVEAGKAVDGLLGDKKGNVIAPYGGDTAFLYQTNHRGWPLMEGTIEEMITKGAHYYVSANFDDLTNDLIARAKEVEKGNSLTDQFNILKQTDRYVIIQLVSDKLLPK